MSKLIQRINIRATFAQLEQGDVVEFDRRKVTESNVRSTATRYAKETGNRLKVTTLKAADKITVYRVY